MNRVRFSLCLAAAATLPFTVGVGAANAGSLSAGQDGLYVDTASSLSGLSSVVILGFVIWLFVCAARKRA